MKINLNDITICSADCVTQKLALIALEKSNALCRFKDAILFTDMDGLSSENIRIIKIEKLKSKDDYSRFILKELYKYISTPYLLIIQWDGYVIDANAWNPVFKEYDLIGAQWDWHPEGKRVGNGGFTFRSLKLMTALAGPQFPFIADMPEDHQICHAYRQKLTDEFGIKFAPENIADAFAYERTLPSAPTFGFHGLYNMWRYVEDNRMIEYSGDFSPHLFHTQEYMELVLEYFLLRKFKPMKYLYDLAKANATNMEIRSWLMLITQDQDFTEQFLTLCETMKID